MIQIIIKSVMNKNFYPAIPFSLQPSLNLVSYDMAPDHKNLNTPFPATKTGRDRPALFASALAHEIRNPLTNINLSIEMLQSLTTDNELRPYLDIIMRGSSRINQLINELLKCQDMEEVHSSDYSLHQLLDEALAMTEDRILLKKIRVRKEYATEDDRICVDNGKVRIALANIINNAIDAMSYKKGELTLITRSIGEKYALEIADNGIGISKEDLKSIFKPFFTSKPAGMGLGLSTTLEILQYNHVDIDVSSERGQGTCFILFIDKAL
jgi:signal transduction histidine kinase